jgi:hypothetical protein
MLQEGGNVMSIDRNVSKAGRKVSSLTFGSKGHDEKHNLHKPKKSWRFLFSRTSFVSAVVSKTHFWLGVNNLVVKNEFFSWASSSTALPSANIYI